MKAKCPACSGTRFKIESMQIEQSRYPYNSIQCSSCGTLICVVDATNIGAFLTSEVKKQNEAIKNIALHLGIYVDL